MTKEGIYNKLLVDYKAIVEGNGNGIKTTLVEQSGEYSLSTLRIHGTYFSIKLTPQQALQNMMEYTNESVAILNKRFSENTSFIDEVDLDEHEMIIKRVDTYLKEMLVSTGVSKNSEFTELHVVVKGVKITLDSVALFHFYLDAMHDEFTTMRDLETYFNSDKFKNSPNNGL